MVMSIVEVLSQTAPIIDTGKELPVPAPDFKPSGSAESQSLSPDSHACRTTRVHLLSPSRPPTMPSSPPSRDPRRPRPMTPQPVQLAMFDLGRPCSLSEQGPEDEYVDESAIDDHDDSSGEDSVEDSGKSSVDDRFFQRVPSKVNLTSRPSLITLMVAQSERAKKLGNHALQSASAAPRSRAGPRAAPALGASPNGSEEGPLIMTATRHQTPTLKPIRVIPRSSPQPIPACNSHVRAQAVLSQRATRNKMLAAELTKSLRRNLLWERHQKTSTADAVRKRRHISHDMANLSQLPEKPCMKDGKDNATGWNQYFSWEALDGYHSKGW